MNHSDSAAMRAETVTYCTVCETAIDTREWHPVASTRGQDAADRIVPFCSQACRRQWLAGDAITNQEESTS